MFITPNALMRLLRPRSTHRPLIRIGPAGDGGYLVPDDLAKIEAVFSPGVAATAGFELDFADRGIPCFLIDGSISKSPVSHKLIDFEPIWLDTNTSDSKISLSDWVEKKAPNSRNLLLQMDIENAEYEILRALDHRTLKRFQFMVIEFHLLSNKVLKRHQRLDLWLTLRKLNRHHVPVHFHSNNCRGATRIARWMVPEIAEVTWARSDQKLHRRKYAKLPSPLDQNNTPKPYLGTPWDSPTS